MKLPRYIKMFIIVPTQHHHPDKVELEQIFYLKRSHAKFISPWLTLQMGNILYSKVPVPSCGKEEAKVELHKRKGSRYDFKCVLLQIMNIE